MKTHCINLIFTGKAMHFYGLISKLMVLLITISLPESFLMILKVLCRASVETCLDGIINEMIALGHFY